MKKIFFIFLISPIMGFAQSGPAGVGTNDGTSTLKYWVDAGNGVSGTAPITAWPDLSGNGVTNTVNGNLVLNPASLNGQNTITFDATGGFIQTNLSINSGIYPNLTIIAVYKPRVDDAGGVWGEDDGGWDRFMFDAGNISGSFDDAVTNGNGPVTGIPNIFPLGLPVITSVVFQEDIVNGTTVYANGTAQTTYTSDHGPESSNNLQLGAIGSNNFTFDGDMAEIIIYGTSLNEAEKIILNNYLAAKYDISLTTADLYNGDDVLNGNYDIEVAGIGRVDASNIQNAAQGSGILKILNPSGLDDNEFLLWGHDSNTLQAANTTDVPAGVQARWNRLWRANEVDVSGIPVDVGSIDLQWDLSGLGSVTATDLRLLIDTNNDGLFADETPISGATLVSGNIYTFAGVTAIADSLRFTIATANSSQTTLPIGLIKFNAATLDDQTVKLDWQTSSEINSDHFEVLSSVDGINWAKVIQVPSKGGLSHGASYTGIDKNPYIGTSYYRLKQTDVNGAFMFSQIQSVEMEIQNDNNVKVSPNPSSDIAVIKGLPGSEKSTLNLLNLLGEDLTYLVQFSTEGNSNTVINVSELPPGIYILKTKTTSCKLYKE